MPNETTKRKWTQYTFCCVGCHNYCFIDSDALVTVIQNEWSFDPKLSVEHIANGFEYCLNCVAAEEAEGEKVTNE